MPDADAVRAALAEIDAARRLNWRGVTIADAVVQVEIVHSNLLVDAARAWLAEQDRKEANDAT